jgi:hypothetical protein
VIKVIKMFNTERHLNVYKIEEHIWLHETTYTSYPSLNPYLYDSDWDSSPEDAVVYEFVYDEVYNDVNERDRMREKVVEMNKLLCYGNDEMLSLVEKAVSGEFYAD